MTDDLPNIFANSPLDRATHLRTDEEWLKTATSEGFILPLWRGQIFAISSAQLGFLRPGLVKPAAQIGQIFLGIDKKQIPYFACVLDDNKEPSELLNMGEFLDLRSLALEVSVDDIAIAAQARALAEWHNNHIFCARCGGRTEPQESGHKRFCKACELEHFPRTDPVIIMMIVCGNKGFLGRQKIWPAGFYSALAGFIEPGETIEEAVKRESWEEAKIDIVKVSYHSTQPWPYPYSLMIGCLADAASEQFEIDGKELETGRWFDRLELKKLFENKEQGDILLPPPMAIARRLIHAFAFRDDYENR